MKLYKCSRCNKEVLPKGTKDMMIKAYGKVFYRKTCTKKYCQCQEPNIKNSQEEFERENRLIAESIREMVKKVGEEE